MLFGGDEGNGMIVVPEYLALTVCDTKLLV